MYEDNQGYLAMTDEQSRAIETMRERGLGEYVCIHKKDNCITFFEEIRVRCGVTMMRPGSEVVFWRNAV